MMTAIKAIPTEKKPCIIGGARIDQSAIPIRALIPVSFTAQTQPKISIIPITRQIFSAARQPPKWLANTPMVALEKNIGIKPGIIRIEEPQATVMPTAIS